MNEINENNIIIENLIDDNIKDKKSYKTFNILKEIQTLLKNEANSKEICKIIKFITLLFSH